MPKQILDADLDQHLGTPLLNTQQLELYYVQKIEALRMAMQKPPLHPEDWVEMRRQFASYPSAQRLSLARVARDQLVLFQHINF